MTIDEGIKHCEEVVEKLEKQVKPYQCESVNKKLYEVNKKEWDSCLKCAEEHRQLARWLEELKALKEQSCEACCNGNQTEKAKLCQKSYIAGMEHTCENNGDCISRKAVMDIDFNRICATCAKPNEMIRQKIVELPPVTPQPKANIIDKIRAEISKKEIDQPYMEVSDIAKKIAYMEALKIIDKYKAESEEDNGDSN